MLTFKEFSWFSKDSYKIWAFGWLTQTLLYLEKSQPVVKKEPVEWFSKVALFSVVWTMSFKFHVLKFFKNDKDVPKLRSVEDVKSEDRRFKKKFNSRDCNFWLEKGDDDCKEEVGKEGRFWYEDNAERLNTDEVLKVLVKKVSWGFKCKLGWVLSNKSSRSFSTSFNPRLVVELVNQL